MSGRLQSRCRRVRLAAPSDRPRPPSIRASFVILALALAVLLLAGLARFHLVPAAVG